MASRLVAASAGGYAVTSLSTIAGTGLLVFAGATYASALVAMTMASFFVWTAIVMCVFHARSATRAWIWLSIAALPLGVATWWLLPGPGT